MYEFPVSAVEFYTPKWMDIMSMDRQAVPHSPPYALPRLPPYSQRSQSAVPQEFNLYRDISQRTGGEIYVGVVGPVTTGKSTFIKRFMDLMYVLFQSS